MKKIKIIKTGGLYLEVTKTDRSVYVHTSCSHYTHLAHSPKSMNPCVPSEQ